MFEHIRENLENINNDIAAAAGRSGRRPNEITLVAVSKTFSIEVIKAAIGFGITDIGESRLQEAEPKIKSLGKSARWHMIGHLQTNKVKRAVAIFDFIQSVDSLKLAEETSRRAIEINKKIDCLIEVNSGGEVSKSGVAPEMAPELIDNAAGLKNINLRGIMTIGPLTEEKQLIRRAFRNTRELFEIERKSVGPQFDTLSMGMSDDYEMAIEEGSNMVRIGTALFGERKK
ncbi:MAG: YggS family pyridoxal phosphate-dependent enzyme [Candidatus Zixiibacteriota bacterium]